MGPGKSDLQSRVLRIKICDRGYIFDLPRLEFPEKGEQGVKAEGDEATWVKRMRQKVESEMAKKEIEALLYWKGELEKILGRRPESLGTFQLEIQNLIQRMQNRIRVLKNSLQE